MTFAFKCCKGAASPWSTRGRIACNDQGSSLVEEESQGRPPLALANMSQGTAGGQSVATPDTNIQEPHEGAVDQVHTGRLGTACASASMEQRTCQEKSAGGPRELHLGRTRGGSALPPETQNARFMAQDAECLSETQERVARCIRQLEEVKIFA